MTTEINHHLSGSSASQEAVAWILEPFVPEQIVCLEGTDDRLYCEVIQTVPSRQVCWVRPLILMPNTEALYPEVNHADAATRLIDVRQTADLIWPMAAFRAAWDTEVIPLLSVLTFSVDDEFQRRRNHRCLQEFIQRCWQKPSSPTAKSPPVVDKQLK